MFIGVARFELFIPASRSLKDKRQLLRSVVQSVRARYNVAIAEVDFQDKWQRAALGVSCVSQSNGHCMEMLVSIEKAVGSSAAGVGEIVERELEVIALEDL